MSEDLIYKMALTYIPNLGLMQRRTLLNYLKPKEVFNATKKQLKELDGINVLAINSIAEFNGFNKVEEEIKFIEKHNIKPLFITDEDYPQRLLQCNDAPIMLYYKGDAELNNKKIVAIIGTRGVTKEYGVKIIETFLKDLSPYNVLVVSGMAIGADAVAHKAALDNQLPTVGVLAHGLDRIYPAVNKSLAQRVIEDGGGLLTELRKGTLPDRYNFPARNRIVAGMSDATIVVESDIKGGSMITAEIANSYNRDVFAFPGRTTDHKSNGCNYLIRTNKASLITCANDFLEMMNWDNQTKKKKIIQQKLFVDLSEDEKKIVEVLNKNGNTHIDALAAQTGLANSAIAIAILNLELNNLIETIPGKMYAMQ